MEQGSKFAAFDIDGTLIRWQLYHAIADRLVRLGYVPAEAYQPIKDARMQWKRREQGATFKTYEHKLVLTYSDLLNTLEASQVDEAIESVFEEYKDQVYVYTRDLLKSLKQAGYLLFAISGSQTEIVQKMAEHYGFDDFLGSTYERSGNKFTGENINYLGRKDAAVQELASKHSASFKNSIAAGDSLSDIAMLEMVEHPIAFNPERELFEVAAERGWRIVIERKNMVYELEAKDGKYQLVSTG
jgi:HAD superfamily hydrolase (TIGR01490 family)